MKIVPTILSNSLDEIKRQIKLAEAFAEEVDLDIVDGKLFEGEPTPSFEEILSIDTSLVKYLHLMVKEPEEYVKTALLYGVRAIVVHAEANLEWLNFDEIPVEMGIAINPSTPVKSIERYFEEIDLVQVMTVEPGKQGNPFLMEQLDKVRELKAMKNGFEVKVDGGVNQETISSIESAGTDIVVVGSDLWKSVDPKEEFRALQEIIQNN